MKKFKIVAIVCASFMIPAIVHAQKIKLESGNLDFLKGQKALKIEYSYDDMQVGKMTEEDYIKRKVADYNKDEPGRGDKWHKAWINDRKARFQPQFESLLNKYLEDVGVTINSANNDSKYEILLKTTMTEPGWNVGVMRSNAYINTDVIFFDKDNPDQVLAKIVITKSPGRDVMGYDFDTGLRIQEAYAKCGKALGKYLTKNVFK